MTFQGKALTKADENRRRCIHAGPCMACLQRGIDMTASGYVQWHHTAGKKRHDLTCGLCCWHHQGYPMFGKPLSVLRIEFGPSLAEGSKPFHAEFGSNEHLLQLQNEYLGVS